MNKIIVMVALLLPVQLALADAHEMPDAVAADPAHYTVEFENDVIRILRIKYGDGETSVMHTHPANCGIQLTGGSWRMTLADGEVVENHYAPGQVHCFDGGAHQPTNITGSPAELILVEIKGREKVGGR